MKSIRIKEERFDVLNCERLNNSPMGNPRYKFVLDNGSFQRIFKTAPNSGMAYSFSTDTFLNKSVDITYHMTPKGEAILDSIEESKLKETIIGKTIFKDMEQLLQWYPMLKSDEITLRNTLDKSDENDSEYSIIDKRLYWDYNHILRLETPSKEDSIHGSIVLVESEYR